MPRISVAFLVGCLLVGCIYVDERGQAGEVEFSWTLNGWQCKADPFVHSIRISIPGEVLHNDGYYPCALEGAQGMVLKRFYSGLYNYTVEALDFYGTALYSTTGSFYVNGYTPVHVNLLPLLSGIRLSWSLMMDATRTYRCRDYWVGNAIVYIDGIEKGRFPCEEGEHPASVSIPNLQPGSHVLEVYVEVADGIPFYYRSTFLKASQSPEPLFAPLYRR